MENYYIPQKMMSCDNCRNRRNCPDKTGVCRSYIYYKVPLFNNIFRYNTKGKIEKEMVLGMRYSFPLDEYFIITNKAEYKLRDLDKTIFMSKSDLKLKGDL